MPRSPGLEDAIPLGLEMRVRCSKGFTGHPCLILVDELHAAFRTIAGAILHNFRVHLAGLFVDVCAAVFLGVRVFAADEEGGGASQREDCQRRSD